MRIFGGKLRRVCCCERSAVRGLKETSACQGYGKPCGVTISSCLRLSRQLLWSRVSCHSGSLVMEAVFLQYLVTWVGNTEFGL